MTSSLLAKRVWCQVFGEADPILKWITTNVSFSMNSIIWQWFFLDTRTREDTSPSYLFSFIWSQIPLHSFLCLTTSSSCSRWASLWNWICTRCGINWRLQERKVKVTFHLILLFYVNLDKMVCYQVKWLMYSLSTFGTVTANIVCHLSGSIQRQYQISKEVTTMDMSFELNFEDIFSLGYLLHVQQCPIIYW